MPKFIATTIFLLTLAMTCAAQKTPKMSAAEKYIRESEAAWAHNSVTHETKELKQFIADDFVGTAPSGARYNKRELLSDTGDEMLSNELDEVTVRFYGNTAVAQGSESFVMKDGRRGRFVWTDTWWKRNGKWQIVAAQDVLVKEPQKKPEK